MCSVLYTRIRIEERLSFCRPRGRRELEVQHQSRMVTPVSAEAIAIAGGGVAQLAALVLLILTLHGRVVAELVEVRGDLHALADALLH